MKDYLKHLADEDYDTFFFLPHDDKKGQMCIQGNILNDPGIKLDGSASGDCYHIILFKYDKKGNPIHLDKFEAILMAPLEYMSTLIPDDWYGIICRKTTTSKEFVEDTFDKIKALC
jgi:hypothetical protein